VFRIRIIAPIVPALVVSIVLAVAMRTADHDWGDDFAAYIMQAVSILHGTEQHEVARSAFAVRESSRYFGPVAAPWGFPALLAPVYAACGGLNIRCLKLANVPMFALFVLAFFLFLRSRLALADAVLVASAVAVNPVFLDFQNNVLSDIAFLGLSTLGVLLVDRIIVRPNRPEGSPGGNVAIGVAIFLAFFVRANGALLVPTLLITQAALLLRTNGRRRPARRLVVVAAVPYAVFGLLVAGLLAVFPTACTSDVSHYGALTFAQILANISAYLVLPSVFFWSLTFYELFYGALIPFLLCGLVWFWKDDLHLAAYSGLTVILFVLWPEQQGLRYLFPILPFLVYFCYRGMRVSAFGLTERYRRAGDWLTRGVWTGVLVSFLLASIRLALHPTPLAGPFQPATTAMFEAVRQQAAPGDVVIFDKPRLMRLMTDRDAILIDRCDELAKGRFVVVRKAGGATAQIAPGEIATCDPALELTRVFDNRLYAVYRIARRPGPA